MSLVGIDIGGTNVDIGIIDSNGLISKSVILPTLPNEGPEKCIHRVVLQMNELIKQCDIPRDSIEGIGVGCPGPLDLSKGAMIDPPNFPKTWNKYSIKDNLQSQLKIPVELDNDANAATLGELWVGGGRGVKDFLVLTLGTGIGGGIMANGKIVRGSTGQGGELGHITVYHDGETCGCGKKGCLEAYASATAMVKAARELLNSPEYQKGTSQLEKVDENQINAKLIFDLAKQQDPLAIQIVKRAGEALGLGIGSLLNVFNPQKIILAGRISRSFDVIYPHIQRMYKTEAFPSMVKAVSIEASPLIEHSGIIGAAAVYAYEHGLIREESNLMDL